MVEIVPLSRQMPVSFPENILFSMLEMVALLSFSIAQKEPTKVLFVIKSIEALL